MKNEMKRIQNFQALRGVAFLLIFISHCFGNLKWWGASGVSLFIILSGFLEGMKYSNAKYPPLEDYVKRKIGKIYPLHLATLIISIPLSVSLFRESGALKYFAKLIVNALMLQSWIPIESVYFSFNAVSWYLSLVILFAVVSPFLVKKVQESNYSGLVGIGGYNPSTNDIPAKQYCCCISLACICIPDFKTD